jgi:hypothetical protein
LTGCSTWLHVWQVEQLRALTMDELGGTGCSPLHCAAHQGQAEALKVLLHAGGHGVCCNAPKTHVFLTFKPPNLTPSVSIW